MRRPTRENLALLCKWIMIPLVLLALDAFYFRHLLGTSLMPGDLGDGRFCTLTAEHWFQFALGKVHFSNMNMYDPVLGTAGYSDLLLGFAPIYVPLRFCGLDLFAAYQATLIVVHAIGTLSMYFFLMKCEVHPAASVIGTILFAYSNPLNSSLHTQLFALYFIPLLAIALLCFYESRNGGRVRRMAFGFASVVLLEGIFYTSVYMGYFVSFYGMIFFFSVLVFSLWKRKPVLKPVLRFLKRNLPEVLLYLTVAVVLFVPFEKLYLPIGKIFGKRSWEDVSTYLPRISDYINLANNNLLYGKLLSAPVFNTSGEQKTGFPLGTLLVFFVAFIVFLARCIRMPSPGIRAEKMSPATPGKAAPPSFEPFSFFAFCASFSVILCFLVILKVGNHDSLWWFFYKVVPGMGNMRAVSRMNEFLTFPVAVSVSMFLHYIFFQKWTAKAGKAVLLVLLVYFQCEYTWISPAGPDWDANAMRSLLARVPAPPSDCEVIYVIEKPKTVSAFSNVCAQLDGWMIATHFGVKTINGYSGYTPPGWGAIQNAADPAYQEHIRDWVKLHQLEGVYAYRLEDNVWVKENDGRS